MIELPIIDAPDQTFGAILNGRRTTIRVRYNTTTDRWSFNLSIDDQPVLHGRRIVLGVDLLAGFDFGLGALIAYAADGSSLPDRENLPGGLVRLYHATPAEIAAAA